MTEEEIEDEIKPLEVVVKNQQKIKEIQTSIETQIGYEYIPSDEEIKEMQDAQ